MGILPMVAVLSDDRGYSVDSAIALAKPVSSCFRLRELLIRLRRGRECATHGQAARATKCSPRLPPFSPRRRIKNIQHPWIAHQRSAHGRAAEMCRFAPRVVAGGEH